MPAGSRYWISEGMLGKAIYNADVNSDGKADHICFSIKNKFLHPNHPLGWIRKFGVSIDGEKVNPDKACFVIRNQWIPLKYMPTIRDIWWNGAEDAWIYVESPGFAVGGVHKVQCSLALSLMVHNENIDRNDDYNCLCCDLEQDMTVQEEVKA